MIVAPPPPAVTSLPSGHQLVAGAGVSTVLPDLDFETYSEAGYVWSGDTWVAPQGAKEKGLKVVGLRAYAEHPTTEVLSLAYDLKDGRGKRLWVPGLPNPTELFEHLQRGGLLAAWNMPFEETIWNLVCTKRYGWPLLPASQLRCDMAKSRAFALPGSLGKAGEVLGISDGKDKDGKRLLNKFSVPRKPTKKDSRLRIHPSDDPEDGQSLYQYNLQDIVAEANISACIPDLSADELEYWQVDRAINRRGVAIDVTTIEAGVAIISQAYEQYNRELEQLTGGAVKTAASLQKLTSWLASRGLTVPDLTEDTVTEALKTLDLPADVRRALEIREMVGSASVKKLYAMRNQSSKYGRLHDLFVYHSARTGRAAGSGPQPQNLPSSGPSVVKCDCGKHFAAGLSTCPWCNSDAWISSPVEWGHEAMADAIECIKTGDLALVERVFGNAVKAISGCLRGMFVAAPGHRLVCSDFSAIEAVVAACLAGEQWRIDAFNQKKDIYLASISMMTGIHYDEYIAYQKANGTKHPDRKIGKVAELASGYQGWLGAWLQFGAGDFFPDERTIKNNILAWRRASPAIVEMWGGQYRGVPWDCTDEYFGLEGAAVQAVLRPGETFSYRGIAYWVEGDILYCMLPSSRLLHYHRPRLSAQKERRGFALSYEGWNTNPKNGKVGWIRIYTHGGKLFENVVQAVARDILAFATINLEKAGYPVVLHIHDEIVAEVRDGVGSVEEFERIMATMPPWAEGWPIRAAGGWEGHRYRKD